MNQYQIRNYQPSDEAAIHLINDAEIPNVTLFAPGELQRLAHQAFYCRVAQSEDGEVVGFVLALDENAHYSSLNFQWFKSRYSKFIYIDRIVVSARAQGKGVGQLLYADLLRASLGISPLLGCEVNIRPSNPTSMRFHQKFGFTQVGEQDTEGGRKTVALMTVPVDTITVGETNRILVRTWRSEDASEYFQVSQDDGFNYLSVRKYKQPDL